MQNHRQQKVTIKDIARMCNVSTQTISRVINHRPDVSDDTRQLVEKMIEEMGYHPSALARSLVKQRSFTLGVITAGLKYVGVAQTLNGITEECEASGYALLIKELPSFNTPKIVPLVENLISHEVEGIIFAAPDINDNIAVVQSQLPSYCPPIVFLKGGPNPRFTTISIDNYGGACMAVEHLYASGRKHIGFISGPLDWLESRQRKQGWMDTIQKHNGCIDDSCWTEGNWSSSSGAIAAQKLITKYSNMDAVFVSNDQMALGLLHYAHENQIRVPEDLAVIGFDDLTESEYFSPALTTIEHPLRDLGVLAVKTLLKQIESTANPTPIETIVLKTELVKRDSA
jgi:LacI family transcriptional regulator